MRARTRQRSWPSAVGLAVVAAVGLAWAGWLATGGGLFWVGSPSMGRAAPVGSLVVTQPLPPGQPLRVGEVVVFHPGLDVPTTYVHRIEAVLPVPGRPTEYRTKGDLNRLPDPWVITRSSVVGRPVAIVPAVGWLYRSATWLLLGAAVVAGLSFVLTGGLRRVVLVLGPMLLVAVPAIIDHPFVSGFLYGSGQHGRRVVARVVDTGVLPVSFTVHGGHPVRAVPGQEVVAAGTVVAHRAVVPVRVAADLPWWGWALVVAFCLLPLAVNAWLSRGSDLEPDDATDVEPDDATDVEPDDATDVEPDDATDVEPGDGAGTGAEADVGAGTGTGSGRTSEVAVAVKAPVRETRTRSGQPVAARSAAGAASPGRGS